MMTLSLPGLAWPCSLAASPKGAETIVDGGVAPRREASPDTVPPGAVTVTDARLVLFSGTPCDGLGNAECPQLDRVTFGLSAADDQTTVERLRFAVSFGSDAASAERAAASLLVEQDFGGPTTISAYLGLGGKRSETGFSRSSLCVTFAAIDDAGNVGPRSAARCLNTLDRSAAEVLQGVPCVNGCSSATGALMLPLVVFLGRRPRRARSAMAAKPRKITIQLC
ncbi:MAG: hypothetical protein Q8N26_08300 [Myxococcales bacterium]|nr:hypothetical protein [Myxococcales bacterium]